MLLSNAIWKCGMVNFLRLKGNCYGTDHTQAAADDDTINQNNGIQFIGSIA
jgi:hypothetical protein